MKKLLMLLVVVSFVALGAQAFASPPIKPPVEGFIIDSYTFIDCVPDANGENSVVENESFKWTYFEGWGQGVFYPNGYDPSHCANCGPSFYDGYVVAELGFTEGAELAYEQEFQATNGITVFEKTFQALSDPEPGDDNLKVDKTISFDGTATGGSATHLEKVGLSVISMGFGGATTNPASGLLSLCPWAAEDGPGSTPGYPPTNEAIAAASQFDVTKIEFTSKSRVNSSINPALKYDVTAEGEGFIAAGFIVDLWEGPAGYVWGPYLAADYGVNAMACPYLPQSTHIVVNEDGTYEVVPNDCYILPQVYGEPPLASRTEYKEHAEASGIWTFTKNVSYESTLPGVVSAGTFPFQQVP